MNGAVRGKSPRRGPRAALAASLRLRLVLGFLLLALGLALTFVSAGRLAFGVGWRDAARPVIADYVDRLTAEIAPGGTPDLQRAQALAARLPITLRIEGPTVNWASHPARADRGRERDRAAGRDRDPPAWREPAPHPVDPPWRDARPDPDTSSLRTRVTADGHQLVFGVDTTVLERRPGVFVGALGVLLALTLLAYLYVRRQLRPLDAIRAGAQRFGAGEFDRPIPVADTARPDELGQVARTLNTMGEDIRGMLDAKRGLLLAISHELRSPLTRARLHVELLPETPQTAPQRDALLHDLAAMGRLIADLLESERLAQPHAALHREPVDVGALVREVVGELGATQGEDGANDDEDGAKDDRRGADDHHGAATDAGDAAPDAAGRAARPARADCPHRALTVRVDRDLPPMSLDPARIRLLLRNLLDNAWRHGGDAARSPELTVRAGRGSAALRGGVAGRGGLAVRGSVPGPDGELVPGVWIEVRDHGPGVPDEQLGALAEPFYRPDSARTRAAGGVGLGLHLCRLVAQAHDGRMEIANARPGLRVGVWLPA